MENTDKFDAAMAAKICTGVVVCLCGFTYVNTVTNNLTKQIGLLVAKMEGLFQCSSESTGKYLCAQSCLL